MDEATTASASAVPRTAVPVDAWIIDTDAVADRAEALARCLAEDERERCARLADPVLRRRWLTARATLRHVLARRTGGQAGSLVLHRTGLGKPFLGDASGVEFSLSHSRQLAIIAVAATAIGVDVEHDRTLHRLHRTARRFLHADTVDHLLRLPPHRRPDAFLRAWTLREAHIKAVGGGLFHTPDSLPFDPDCPVDGTPVPVLERDTGVAWSLARLHPAPGASVAIVARGTIAPLRIHGPDTTRKLLEEIA